MSLVTADDQLNLPTRLECVCMDWLTHLPPTTTLSWHWLRIMCTLNVPLEPVLILTSQRTLLIDHYSQCGFHYCMKRAIIQVHSDSMSFYLLHSLTKIHHSSQNNTSIWTSPVQWQSSPVTRIQTHKVCLVLHPMWQWTEIMTYLTKQLCLFLSSPFNNIH